MKLPSVRVPVERAFGWWGHFAYRRAGWIITAVLLLTAGLMTQIPDLEIDTSTEGFLHESDPTRIAYEEFRRQYGRDDLILLAIHGERVFDRAFLESLRDLHRAIEAEVPKIEEVNSLVNARETRGEEDALVVGELLEDWPDTEAELRAVEARALANPLYRHNLISVDGRTATLTIQTEAYSSIGVVDDELAGFDESAADPAEPAERDFLTGKENAAIIDALTAVIAQHQREGFRIYEAGAPVMTEHLTLAIARDMTKFTLAAIGTIALLLFGLFRRVVPMLLTLTVVILSVITTIATMGLIGTPITVPTQILPSFLLAVGVGNAIHILAIFYQHVRAGDSKEDAIAGALAHSGLPVAITSLTTAGGLLSFLTAQIAPVADLGVFGPLGVIMALVYTILLLPSLIAIFPMRLPKARDGAEHVFSQRLLIRIGEFSARNARAVLTVWGLFAALCLYSAFGVRFSHDVMSWFPEGHPDRVANDFVNEHLGGSAFLEVVIDTGQDNGLHDPEVLRRIESMKDFALEYRLRDVYANSAASPVDILKEIHQALNENRSEFYRIPEDRSLIAQEFLLFENSGSDDLEKVVDSRFSQGRLTIRFPVVDSIQYSPYLDGISEGFSKILGDRARFHLTGLMAVMGRTMEAIIYSMAASYLTSFLAITPLMIILIGNLRLGLVSMIPNMVPMVVTLGLMGWMDLPLDAFTLLIGSISLGLAVDDTTHFLHNFREYYAKSGDPVAAIRETLATAGQAMLFTSSVLSCGFFVYMFATMSNLFNFGLLSGFTILVAATAEAFLTPALLTLFAPAPQIFRDAPEGGGH